MKAYEIRNAMIDTLDIFLESEGTESDQENYEYVMAYLKEELQNKSSNFIKYIRNLQLETEMAKAEATRLTAIAKQKENKVESLKRYLKNILVSLDMKKIETELGSYGLRKSSRVEVLDQSKIPREFIRVKTEEDVDKKSLGDYIKLGNLIEGARVVEDYSLQIR